MKRRTFIIASAGILAGLTLPQRWRPALAARSQQATGYQALVQSLASIFSSPDNARVVGSHYLREYPEISDRQQLMDVLGLDTRVTHAPEPAFLREMLRDRQQQDFLMGDTVLVNRWILSRTEASLCALVALS